MTYLNSKEILITILKSFVDERKKENESCQSKIQNNRQYIAVAEAEIKRVSSLLGNSSHIDRVPFTEPALEYISPPTYSESLTWPQKIEFVLKEIGDFATTTEIGKRLHEIDTELHTWKRSDVVSRVSAFVSINRQDKFQFKLNEYGKKVFALKKPQDMEVERLLKDSF